jgi:hypothetical protein
VLLLAPAAWLLRRCPTSGCIGSPAGWAWSLTSSNVGGDGWSRPTWPGLRLAASQGLATPAVIGATTDERALGRLVRAAFGHYARSYLESLIVERYAGPAWPSD